MADGSGDYVGQLDATFPDGSVDQVRDLDNGQRKTRGVLVASFPYVTGVVTASHTELNALDGITADVDELNTLDGILSTVGELNVLSGFTGDTAGLNALADYKHTPKLIHAGSAAVAATTVLVEITLEAGYDYKIIGRSLSATAQARLVVRIGDGTSIETGGYYHNLFHGYGSSSGNYGNYSDNGIYFQLPPFYETSGQQRYAFEGTLFIGENDANSTQWQYSANGYAISNGQRVENGACFMKGSSKTTLTRFDIYNPEPNAVADGGIFIWRLPKEV